MENFEIKSLRNVVKEGGLDVVENFEKKFKEINIEGKRKVSSSAMYTEQLLRTHCTETEIEAMYVGKDSEARKILQRNNSFKRRRQSFDGQQRSLSQGSQYGSSRSIYEGFRSGGRDSSAKCDPSRTQERDSSDFPRCIRCRCQACNQTKKTCKEIKKLILEKLNVKIVDKVPDSPTSVNLCEEVEAGKELMINYTYTDMGRQMMILDIGAPVSIAGVPWMEQYL